jgi:hypothetical protein
MICQELREMMSRAVIAPPNVDKPIQYSDLAALCESTLAAMNKTLAALQEMTDSGFILRPATAERLGGVVIGDGLSVDAAGRASVDFSQMPTDKMEVLLAALRVPIWLTATANWYVDGANGNDSYTNEQIGSKGRSWATAFKTPAVALNFVASDFNLGAYDAVINIAGGLYAGPLALPKYNATTGRIYIRGADIAQTQLQVTDNNLISTVISAGAYTIEDLILHMISNNAAVGVLSAVNATGGSAITFNRVEFRVDEIIQGRTLRSVLADGGKIAFGPGCIFNSNGFSEGTTSVYSLFAGIGGNITIGSDLKINGHNFITAYALDGGSLRCVSSRPIITGNVTGRRYRSDNGFITIYGGGPNYFPGTIAGDTAGIGQYS